MDLCRSGLGSKPVWISVCASSIKKKKIILFELLGSWIRVEVAFGLVKGGGGFFLFDVKVGFELVLLVYYFGV